MVLRAGRGTRDRPPEEFGRHSGCLTDQQVRGPRQPVQHPFVYWVAGTTRPAQRPEQLPGDPVRRGGGLSERTPRIAMPGGTHRHRHLLIQRGTNQWVPEPQAGTRLGQHPGGAGLVEGRYQVRHATVQHDREVRHGEVDAKQGCRSQHLAHGCGDEAQAVRDRRRQRSWRGTVFQHRGPGSGHRHARTAGQRVDQFDDVERVARRAVGQPQQPVIRFAADTAGDQFGHRRPVEAGEPQPRGAARHPAQRKQVVPLRHRPHHPDQQQRRLLYRPRQPPPQGDARLVGPLQIVHHQHRRLNGALLGDQRQQLLRQRRRHIRAPVSGCLAPQQPQNHAPPGIRRGVAYPQGFEQRQQRQGLAQFVPGAPEHLTTRPGHRQGRAHQRGLADARLALDQYRPASPGSHFRHELDKHRDLSVAADQRTARGDVGHGVYCTAHGYKRTSGTIRVPLY